MDKNARLHLELNPARLAQIIDAAVVTSSEIVNFHFHSLEGADLSQPSEVAGKHRFSGPAMSAGDRRAMHERWILAKAFQDLLRAVRLALEEAHVFVALLTRTHKIKSSATFSEFLAEFQRKAAGLRFPELLDAVNEKLEPKILFASAYVSLQRARNCLEHRDGIVSKVETCGGDSFTVHVPRMKTFYMRNGNEIELEEGHVVDPGDDRKEVEVLMKIETRQRSIPVGERLSFSVTEFGEIAFACHFLGNQLATKLPKPQVAAET